MAAIVLRSSPKINATLERLDQKLVASGFNRLPLGTMAYPNVHTPLLGRHEIVYNRGVGADGKPNSKSNYFVFVKAKKDSLHVMHSNPDVAEAAGHLAAWKIRLNHSTFTGSSDWVDETVGSVKESAEKKPETRFFIDFHGHFRTINGYDLVRANMDDGKTSEISAIRQEMLYNYDQDWKGAHNNPLIDFLPYLSELEWSVGITKGPGFELTLPYKTGAKNGPHMNLRFASIDDARFFSNEVLAKGRSGNYPPFAPLADPQVILSINRGMAGEGKLVVGLPHIFSNNSLPGVGLGNRVAMGDYSFEYMLDFVRENVHGVGAFNLDNPVGQRLKFKDSSTRQKFLKIAKDYWEKTGRRGSFVMTPNLMCLALSDYFHGKGGFGKWSYADHDTHLYWDVKFGKFKLNVHRLGRAYTYIDLEGTGIDPLAFKSDPKIAVSLALQPGAYNYIKSFIPLSNYLGIIDIPLSRKNDTFYQKAYEFWQDFKTVVKKLPTLASDVVQGALSVKR